MNYYKRIENDEYNNRMVVQPDAGLGNRLYCLYSALYYSQILGRSFDLIWLRENCCNVPYDEIFDRGEYVDKFRVYTTYHLGYKNAFALKTVLSNIWMAIVKKRYAYYNSEETRKIFNEKGEDAFLDLLSKDDRICVKANGRFIDLEHFASVRDIIKPSKQIAEMVDEIMSPYISKQEANVVGIHIRRTDNKHSIENSPIEAFWQIMDSEVGANPETIFYVATDDAEVEMELKQKYNVIAHKTFGDSKSRDSASGIKDAYVDMLCLSKCSKIYGSYGSSFSEMAALIGDIELEIVTK